MDLFTGLFSTFTFTRLVLYGAFPSLLLLSLTTSALAKNSIDADVSSDVAPYLEIQLSGPRIANAPLATADFNNDGYKEIVAAGQDGILYVVSTSDGANWNNVWAQQTNDDILAAGPPSRSAAGRIESAPAIADLDGNGTLEIVVTVGGDVHHEDQSKQVNGGVLVYTYTSPWNFSLIQTLSADGSIGWPQPRIDQVGWPPPGFGESDGFWDGITTTPALGDLDGDGDLEIVVEGIDRRLHAWHHNGAVVAGWPIYGYLGEGQPRGPDNMSRGGLASPAIGDLDGDGDMEVVFGTMNQQTTLWAVDGNSNPIPGFPIEVEQLIHSSPSLGDIDGDGDLEIVTGSGWGKSDGRENLVFAWHHDGTAVANWPQETQSVMQAPPSLGDIDGDGDLEIVIGCGGFVDLECDKLYAWHGNGTAVAGFPVALPSPASRGRAGLQALKYSPLLVDFDGDDTVEIIATQCTTTGFVVVEPNGQVSDLSHTVESVLMAPPMVDDVDNDDKLEILVGHANPTTQEAMITIWHEEGAASSAQPWPMFRQGVSRAGVYQDAAPPVLNVPTSELTLIHQSGLTSSLAGTIALQNDGGGEYDWTVSSRIRGLTLSTRSGTFPQQSEITFRLDPSFYNGQGWDDIGTITINAEADGAPIEGSAQTVSVRFFSGDISRMFLPIVD